MTSKNKTRWEQIKNRTRVLTVDKLGSDLFKRLHDTIILKYIKLSICAVIFTGACEREREREGEREREREKGEKEREGIRMPSQVNSGNFRSP